VQRIIEAYKKKKELEEEAGPKPKGSKFREQIMSHNVPEY